MHVPHFPWAGATPNPVLTTHFFNLWSVIAIVLADLLMLLTIVSNLLLSTQFPLPFHASTF
jgi:hypothetical protein